MDSICATAASAVAEHRRLSIVVRRDGISRAVLVAGGTWSRTGS